MCAAKDPCSLTVLLQLGEAVVADASRLVLQVLQIELAVGTCRTHHLTTHDTEDSQNRTTEAKLPFCSHKFPEP